MAIGVHVREWSLPRPDMRTLIGIGLAAVAALLVLWLTRPVPTVPILVAGSDLPAGTPLADLDLDVRRTTNSDGMVLGDGPGDLADWVLVAPIVAGEPLLPSLLRPPDVRSAPDLLAVEIDEAHAVLGRIDPGDHVDVYASVSQPGEPTTTRLIASSVYVVDGTRTIALDTEENRQAYPYSPGHKPGCGFPAMRLVGLFSLGAGCCVPWPLGR
jgi:Flp pilus assembly protein CpaB